MLALEVFLGTMRPYGIDLSSNPEPFLVGCLLSAVHRGESHIAIEGEACPKLLVRRDDKADVIFDETTVKGEM